MSLNSVLRPASPFRQRATSPLADRAEFGAVSVGFASTCEKFIMFRSFVLSLHRGPMPRETPVSLCFWLAPDAAQKKSAAGFVSPAALSISLYLESKSEEAPEAETRVPEFGTSRQRASHLSSAMLFSTYIPS